jgi:hypothetical protein
MDLSSKLSAQLKWMQLRLDPESGAILFRHRTLLCLEIQDLSDIARLLALADRPQPCSLLTEAR